MSVSTDEQHLDMQRQALEAAGCERMFEDQGISGAATERKGLKKALHALKPADVLVVWKLDRLGRSLPHLIETITALRDREVGFQSLQKNIDTTSGRAVLYAHSLAALAEFEREMIRDRTKAGMQAAKRRGVQLGRPAKLGRAEISAAQKMIASGKAKKDVAASFGVSPLTLRRAFAAVPSPQGIRLRLAHRTTRRSRRRTLAPKSDGRIG